MVQFGNVKKISAGLLMYRFQDRINKKGLEVFLGHPGGPFWSKKDEGAWDIPKGEADDGEDLLDAAMREFEEETGINTLDFMHACEDLGEFKRKDGKVIRIWAFNENHAGIDKGFSPQSFVELEWPPRSGKKVRFPEIDRAEFFSIDVAEKKANTTTKEFLRRLKEKLKI